MEKYSLETMTALLDKHEKFCNEQCQRNSAQHAEFYSSIHRLDKDITALAVKVGAISGTVATCVSWGLTWILPIPKG